MQKNRTKHLKNATKFQRKKASEDASFGFKAERVSDVCLPFFYCPSPEKYLFILRRSINAETSQYYIHSLQQEHIHVHTYTHTPHTYIHRYMYSYSHTSLDTCFHTHTSIDTCTQTPSLTHTHSCTCTDTSIDTSVTRLGDLLYFGQLFKACGNNYFALL